MCAATPRITPFTSLVRLPSLKAVSWAAMYSAYWPARRGNCGGIPAPARPWEPAQGGMPRTPAPPRPRLRAGGGGALSAAGGGVGAPAGEERGRTFVVALRRG